MRVLPILLGILVLSGCSPVSESNEQNSALVPEQSDVPEDWHFLSLPKIPFDLPMPASSVIDSNGIISSMPHTMITRENGDEAFLFVYFKSEDWPDTIEKYKSRLFEEYEICDRMYECDSSGAHVISFIGTCGVTCEEQRVFYQGKVYSFKDGCDLTEKARELKRLAFCNIRLTE